MELLKLAIHQRCWPDDNWYLSSFNRAMITAKVCICILLGLDATASIKYFGDSVIVATFNHHEGMGIDGLCYSWEELLTPRSWGHWTYATMSDGAP